MNGRTDCIISIIELQMFQESTDSRVQEDSTILTLNNIQS